MRMTKVGLDGFRSHIQSLLKEADEHTQMVFEELAETENDKDWLFDYLFNDSGEGEYSQMIENEVDRILSDD